METLVVAVRVLLSLAVVLGLLWFMHRRVSKGVRTRGARNPITVSGRQSVGQKASVVVVDVDGRRFLLGVTEQSINVLHSGDAPAAPAAEFARSLAAVSDLPAVSVRNSVSARNPLPKGMIGAASFGTASFGGAPFRSSALGGSVLSPAIWKQTAAALRRAR